MQKMMPKDIVEDVRHILGAQARRSTQPFLTAYQILHKLPESIRKQLIRERSRAGKGSGVYYSAASVVSDAAEMIPHIDIKTLNTSNIELRCCGERIEAGNTEVGLYRLQRQ